MKNLKLIRGKRILQQIQLDETSFKELERKTLTFRPPTTKRQFVVNPVKVNKVELVPSRNSQTLTARIIVTSDSQTKYQTTLEFSDVMFDDSDQHDNTSFKAVDGEEYHIIPIDLNKNNVKVHCNCLDFYYRFAPYNNKDGSLYGQPPPPYKKRSLNHPPVNPFKTIGVCKHLLKSAIALRDVKIIK